VIYSAALAASDDLLSVTPGQLAAAYAVNVIGAVVTAQLAVPALRAAGGGTLLFTGGGFADALPQSLATLALGKLALRAVATMLARELRDDASTPAASRSSARSRPAPRSTPTGSPTPIGRSATSTVTDGVRNTALTAPSRPRRSQQRRRRAPAEALEYRARLPVRVELGAVTLGALRDQSGGTRAGSTGR
jgi:NAD(P)-dependent dehydrogenase (short-subunit alcohol dehydrogenase family)